MARHVVEAARGIDPAKIVVVVGHQADDVQKVVAGPGVETVVQRELLGTGHAVLQARASFAGSKGPVVVLCADTPLITTDTIRSLVELHQKGRSAVTLVSVKVSDPFGYGRVLRDTSGVKAVVEEKDATAAQRKISEVNAGIYCFDAPFLLAALEKLGRNNAQGEYYLPDTISLARKEKRRVSALLAQDADEVMGVNSRSELSRAESIMRRRVNGRWMADGVTMSDPDSVSVGLDVTIGRDTTIYPNVRLEGKTSIGNDCVLYPGSRVVDSSIGDGVTVKDCCVSRRRVAAAPGGARAPPARLGHRAERDRQRRGRNRRSAKAARRTIFPTSATRRWGRT
jgi:bifunctional UDP-N-acetylglucosamine pyrophosphorylase/glucosamine-1-phosphate N-acetyltransferase